MTIAEACSVMYQCDDETRSRKSGLINSLMQLKAYQMPKPCKPLYSLLWDRISWISFDIFPDITTLSVILSLADWRLWGKKVEMQCSHHKEIYQERVIAHVWLAFAATLLEDVAMWQKLSHVKASFARCLSICRSPTCWQSHRVNKVVQFKMIRETVRLNLLCCGHKTCSCCTWR